MKRTQPQNKLMKFAAPLFEARTRDRAHGALKVESRRLTAPWLTACALLFAAAEASAQDDKAARRIVVSIPDRKLVLLEGERILKVYDVAVGKSSTPSPHGQFTIVNHLINPTWKNIGPGPNNPVGTRWMGLSAYGYGIHGTNAPGSIGKAASHGCIRMRNRDVEELFELVRTGVSVELAEERPQIVAQILANQTALPGAAE